MSEPTPTLTDRYVWAAARRMPEAQRTEFGRELRERIGDEVDARLADGTAPADAERAVLVELGDPDALAAEYADRPMQLIGPRYFLAWRRLLTLLYAIVLPIAGAGLLLAQLLAGAEPGEIAGSVVSTLLALVVHLAFWVTLVFAILERSPQTQALAPWTPEQLRELPDTGRSGRLSDLIASLVFLTLFAVVIVWQQAEPFAFGAADAMPILDPELWSFWLPYFLVLIVLEMLFAIAVYAWGWNWWLVAANVVLNVAFTVPALWLFATGQLLNPEFLEVIGWPWGEGSDVTTIVIVVVFVGVAIWDVVDGVIKTVRGRDGSALALGRI
ncbi:permease prefix domain 1-containing protein [Agromyces sp. NPDC056523]|uniref:permease prefix domain 1-containing protein n=1 Tax=Agromyces sp. NPDC056523 TaxID=3345850 RepID=UPI00366D6B8E